ncbi:Sec7 domain-containing protein [Aspergillus saccharolyticus JOP 1030-1]|uniref:Guanine nucleotide exchange factor n=1 Tax=Aspergillus saccharolyticus JOP 1030-1 TaxID=1450539 RepID=A0A318ZB12_9EURO|nr:guanine nucleotide exchange factor [Aspergillus saccharolyticus JOP 1030-1]PYH44546.1 guanine nucleotide exchange factor [Aspergillus saccharolyticus JOP 1030-1]
MSSSALPIAVDPVALVITECITVTSAMRKHTRWAHSSVSAILGGGAVSRVYDRDSSTPPSPRNGSTPPRPSSRLSVADDDHVLANRWGLRGKKGKSMQDNPLISAFTRLRSDLKGCKNIRTFDAPALLHPFLQVVRSSSTSAAITSLALVALTKFFAYEIISRDSPRLPMAMQLLSAAITHCRFEASDSAADEIVLLRILKLMEGMLSRPEGDLLGDESVCEMMETGLSMCCQVRLSEVLRRSAEMAMVNMCQVIFSRLTHLDASQALETELETRAPKDTEQTTNLKMDPSVDGDTVTSQHPSAIGSDTAVAEQERSSRDSTPDQSLHGTAVTAPPNPQDDDGEEVKPYSLPSIRELFRVLIDLLDPHNRQHTEPMKVMALRIIDVALEVAGPSIAKHPSLANLAQDDLCRYLFQLVRSENIAILTGSLRVAGTLLLTCRSVLKLQQELYLSYLVACLHPKVEIPKEPGINPALYDGIPQRPKLVKPSPSQSSSGRSTPVPVKDRQKLGLEGGSRRPETREAMVESIGVLARIPSFMVELFINYDCDVDRADLCEDMIGLLSRSAFPDSATWSTTNVPPLCLDALLSYVQFIYDRLDEEFTSEGFPSKDELHHQRRTKKIIIKGAQKFNEDPKAGIAYLASQGIIENPDDPVLVARFLKGTARLSKKVLGEFISKRSNEKLLDAFVDLFDFSGQSVVDALRDLLGAFRLPGESPLIERIVTTFTDKYMQKAKPTEVADKDALFVLTYGIIMLNTDLYNSNIRSQNRMSCTDFSRNLRGVNAGQDFAPEFLQGVYDSIKQNEIILPDEHDNQHAFDYAWRELLLKSSSAGELVVGETNIYDAEMFEATWRPVIATLSYVFMSASDDAVYSRVVTGFDQCAQIAARYGLTAAFDRIVFCLASISTLATENPPSTALNTEVQAGEKTVMVSELAVKFGRDFRAQLAAVVLFRVLAGNEATAQQGWTHVIRILSNLFINALIPPLNSSLNTELELSPIPLQNPSQVVERDARGTETGLLSAFTSYLSSYAADEPPEPSDEELDNTLCTVDCISACSIDDILTNIKTLPLETVTMLVEALLAQLPEESAPAVIVVKPERPAAGPRAANGRLNASKPHYDPSMLYLLELATALTLRDSQTLASLGERLLTSLQAFVRDARNIHSLALSRIIYYLMSLLRLSYDQPYMRVPVILHGLSGFDQDILDSVAIPLVKSLSRCIADADALRNEISASPDFWSILQRLHPHEKAAPLVFELLQTIVELNPPIVTADNYESAVKLANDFISAGSVGYIEERQRDAHGRRKAVKQPRPSIENEVVARGVKAIDFVFHLTRRIPALIKQSHLEEDEAWSAYWSPIFQSLTAQCINPCRDIRHHAVSTLQRTLLSLEITATDEKEWTAIFDQVLFPLILRLLKPEVYHSDPLGMGETRVQVATLVCKIFLRYLDQLPNWDGMLDLWLRILDILDRMMNSGQGDSLQEAIPESLKNILLVMADGGYLVPPSQDSTREKIWIETKKRLDRFLPDLFQEIFPPMDEKVTSAPVSAVASPNPSASQPEPESMAVRVPEDEVEANPTTTTDENATAEAAQEISLPIIDKGKKAD